MQGNDRGTQYASAIYYYSEEQKQIAEKVTNELNTLLKENKLKCYSNNFVETKIIPASEFYPAHPEHQDYLSKHINGYCNHRIRFKNNGWNGEAQTEEPSNGSDKDCIVS